MTSPTSSLNQPVLELTVDAARVCFLPKQISPTLGNSFNHNAFGFSSLSFPYPYTPPCLPASLLFSSSPFLFWSLLPQALLGFAL